MTLFSLENLLYLGANLFRIYVMYRFARVFFKTKSSTIGLELAAYTLFFVINSAAYLFTSSFSAILVTNLLPLLAITFLYKSKIYVKIIAVILIYAVNMFWDAILYSIFNSIGFDTIVITSGIATALMVFLSELLFEHFSRFKGGLTLNFSHLLAIVFIPAGSIVIGAFTMTKPSVSAVINALILLLINVMVFYLYDTLGQAYEKEREKALLEQQSQAYINQLCLMEESQKAQRFIKHDIENHFMQMKQLIIEEDYNGLSAYLEECSDYIKPERQYSKSGYKGIDSMLNYKLKEIDEKTILIDIKINLPEELSINSFDLNVILGNLVDNAVEELQKCKEGKLLIEVNHKQGVLFINIENTSFNEIKYLNGRMLTSKKDSLNHGLGLQSVQHTLDKYNGTMTIGTNDNLFTVNALLYNSLAL